MTRFAIDAGTALTIVGDGLEVAEGHRLVAAGSVRSEVLSTLYRRVRAGTLDEREGRRLLEGFAELKVRLLSDRVSRRTAWRIASEQHADDTALAEHLAVAVLQADALIAVDAALRAAASGLIPLADIADLGR